MVSSNTGVMVGLMRGVAIIRIVETHLRVCPPDYPHTNSSSPLSVPRPDHG